MNVFKTDDCQPHIGEASRSGALDGNLTWSCPACGSEWRPTVRTFLGQEVRYWEPYEPIMIF